MPMCLWSITKHLLDHYQLFYDGPYYLSIKVIRPEFLFFYFVNYTKFVIVTELKIGWNEVSDAHIWTIKQNLHIIHHLRSYAHLKVNGALIASGTLHTRQLILMQVFFVIAERYCLKSFFLKKWELLVVIKTCPKRFSTIPNSFYSRK